MSCTQSFFGADDLDIRPATSGTITVGRVWIEEHSPIEAELTVDTGGWASRTSSVMFQIQDPHGNAHGGGTVTLGDAKVHASGRAAATGWHAIRLTSSGLPPGGAPFIFTITPDHHQGAILMRAKIIDCLYPATTILPYLWGFAAAALDYVVDVRTRLLRVIVGAAVVSAGCIVLPRIGQ